MFDLEVIKQLLDYGGVFAIAVLLIWGWIKKLDSIDNRLVKLLTLMTLLIEKTTNINDLNHVLGKDKEKVDAVLNGDKNKT